VVSAAAERPAAAWPPPSPLLLPLPLPLQTLEEASTSQAQASQAAQAPGSQQEGGVKLPPDQWEESDNRCPFFASAALGYFGMGSKFAAADLSRRLHVFTRGVGQSVEDKSVVQYAEGACHEAVAPGGAELVPEAGRSRPRQQPGRAAGQPAVLVGVCRRSAASASPLVLAPSALTRAPLAHAPPPAVDLDLISEQDRDKAWKRSIKVCGCGRAGRAAGGGVQQCAAAGGRAQEAAARPS
jgi:hypothetical protein